MKKFLAICLSAICLMNAPVFATQVVIEGGSEVAFQDQEPIIYDGVTYIPIRDVFEALGFKVDWDADNKVVLLTKDDNAFTMNLFTNSGTLICIDYDLNITGKKLSNPVKIENGRTLLPLREILEYANYGIDWDAETKTVSIKDNNDKEQIASKIEKLKKLNDSKPEAYKPDTSKEQKHLTEEEKAYFAKFKNEAMGSVQESEKSLGEDATPEETNKALKEAFETAFAQLDPPESLKDLNEEIKQAFLTYIDSMTNTMETATLLDDESEETKASYSFGIIFGGMIGSTLVLSDSMTTSLNKFAEERNIDLKEETGVDFFETETAENVIE
ncbi:MAG: copper amine oxidase N-terminal domain-containing protein [Firmicutes bacterium]|nr:copper amine oxidase N-terminal domain-containing protein [Bacillota bacterium]